MELKTKINAVDGKPDLIITRNFDLSVDLVFKAYTEAEFLEQWMGTKVIKLESKRFGSWQIETKDKNGNVAFKAHGVIHEFIPNKKITRTFEMENSPFDVQIEFLEFEKLTDETSKLSIHSIYRTVELRDKMLKLPFAQGLNMAHNKLEEIFSK